MKKFKLIVVSTIAFVTISSLVFVGCNKESIQTQQNLKPDFGPKARKKRDPFGPTGYSASRNCLHGQGNCMWCITTPPPIIDENTPLYYLTLLTDNTLLVEYNKNVVNEDGDVLVLNDGFYLPDIAANNQEKVSIQVLPGTYVTTYNTTYGEKILNVICK